MIKILALAPLLLVNTYCRTTPDTADSSQSLSVTGSNSGLGYYEANRILNLQNQKDCHNFRAETGISVTHRDNQGNATEGKIRVLADNPAAQIYIVSDVNAWGATKTSEDKLVQAGDGPYFEGKVRGLRHGMEYRLLVNGKSLLDPAALLFSTPSYYQKVSKPDQTPYLNSIFWDMDHEGAYKMQTMSVDLRKKALIIAESEVMELARKWPRADGEGPKSLHETYKFIATSGIIEELKQDGYNAVEFLPFNTSMDGDHWHFRYQVFGLYAPDSRYGTPDEFKMMIDHFNKAGVGVIMDAVVGHYPYRGNEGLRDLNPIGIHNWAKSDGKPLFGNLLSPWGTYRYDYANPFVRRFLTDSIMTMVCRYGLSGIRFDNLDGIRLYEGPGGGGPDFLKELVGDIRDYRPEAMLIAEMFFGHSPVMQSRDAGGYGINFRTHSDFFDFIKDDMLLSTEAVNMERLRGAIRNPWDWREAARVQYITNHDEAANRRDGATGAYPATLIKGGDDASWYYVEKKTMAFGSLAMLSGSAYLDMPQVRLLQQGSFNDNSPVEWGLRTPASQRAVYDYFAAISNYIKDRPAFAFNNFHANIENHIDTAYGQRIISLMRLDHATGKKIYAVVNLGHKDAQNYRVGVEGSGKYRLMISSDSKAYNGTGQLDDRMEGTLKGDDISFHGKPNSIQIPYVAPYSVSVWEQE